MKYLLVIQIIKKNKFALFYLIQTIKYLKLCTLFNHYRNRNNKNNVLTVKKIWGLKNRNKIFAIFVEISFVKSVHIKFTLLKTIKKIKYYQLSQMLHCLVNKWNQQQLQQYRWDSQLWFTKKMEKYAKFAILNFWH